MAAAQTTAVRERLIRLVQSLPEGALDTAEQVLAGLVALETDPVMRALMRAPRSDEPVAPEDIEAEAEADEDIAAGRVFDHEEAKRRILAD